MMRHKKMRRFMQKRTCAFAALGFAMLFYVASEPESYDGGGSVMKYYRGVQAANRRSQPMAITGTCASACTEKLGIKRICIYPNATLLFHQASLYGVRSEYGNRILMSMYPKPIQNWVRRNGALNSPELTQMTGKEAIRLGVQSCWRS
jgi:hypothetical protein